MDDLWQPVAVSSELYTSSDGSKVYSSSLVGTAYGGYLTFSTDGSKVLLSSKHAVSMLTLGMVQEAAAAWSCAVQCLQRAGQSNLVTELNLSCHRQGWCSSKHVSKS